MTLLQESKASSLNAKASVLSSSSSSRGITSSPRPSSRVSGHPKVVSAIQSARPRSEGTGVEIYLHSSTVSGKELKSALDTLFPGPQDYSVQLRRDRYRVTLPNHNQEQIQSFMFK